MSGTPSQILARKTFSVSRLSEFASEAELVKQTGHDADDWPLVIVKELVDNAYNDLVTAISDIDDEKSTRRRHVKSMSGRRDERCASQRTVRIKTNGFAFFEEIVVGVSVYEGRDVADDKSLFAIGNVNVCVKQIDRLLFVLGNVQTGGIEREGARKREAGRIFRVNARALTKR